MTAEQLAERIMDRIEKDQAIHKSSIVEELQLACAPVAKPVSIHDQIQDQITRRIEAMKQRDGYPVQAVDLLNDWTPHRV